MAPSTFPSQNVQNTPAPDHFWKFQCRKSARRCGAKHISKSKCTKHTMLGPLLEVSCCRAFVCLFLHFALSGFCLQQFGDSAPPGVPFVLQFWWSCPFCCVSLPLGGCVWHWSFVAGHCCWRLSFDAQGLLHAGVFFFLLVVVLGGCLLALWGFCPPGMFVFFPWAFGWLRWRLSCGICLFSLWGFCFLFLLVAVGRGCHLSNGPRWLLLMVGVAFCASGLLLLSWASYSSLPFSFSSSSWLSSLSVCVLWSSSCFPCLVSGLPLCLAW